MHDRAALVHALECAEKLFSYLLNTQNLTRITYISTLNGNTSLKEVTRVVTQLWAGVAVTYDDVRQTDVLNMSMCMQRSCQALFFRQSLPHNPKRDPDCSLPPLVDFGRPRVPHAPFEGCPQVAPATGFCVPRHPGLAERSGARLSR